MLCAGTNAKSCPSLMYGGTSLRSSSSSSPAAPKMIRRITFSVILFIGSKIRNSLPSGQFAHFPQRLLDDDVFVIPQTRP